MSGCHDANVKCNYNCHCHIAGYKIMLTTFPGKLCCNCSIITSSVGEPFNDELMKQFAVHIQDMKLRLDKLENTKANSSIVATEIVEIKEKLDNLEERLNLLVRRYNDAANVFNNKIKKLEENNKLSENKPHVCPSCKSLGYLPAKLITDNDKLRREIAFSEELKCPACNGKGIVWSS